MELTNYLFYLYLFLFTLMYRLHKRNTQNRKIHTFYMGGRKKDARVACKLLFTHLILLSGMM